MSVEGPATPNTPLLADSINTLKSEQGVNLGTRSANSSISLASSYADDPLTRSLSIRRNLSTSKITAVEAFIHLLKGNIGSGFLSIPFAISISGLAVGPPLLVVVAFLCTYCMLLLLKCAKHLAFMHEKESLGYGDVCEIAFQEYFRTESQAGRHIVNTFLLLTQLGFCSVYFILIPTNIKTTVENYNPDAVLPLKVYMTILLVFIMLTSFIWNIKALALVSMLGNLFIFVGLLAITIYIFLNLDYNASVSDLLVGDPNKLPIFFGMAIYSFEGIGLVLPLEQQMLRPKKFPLIMTLGMALVVVAQLFFGTLGYLCFRDNTLGSLTFNLPAGVISTISLLTIAFCVYLTYPLMFYVAIEILSPQLKAKFSNVDGYTVEFVLRTVLVILTYLFAIVIPHIELFIALIGAMACSSLALIIPPLLYFMIFRLSVFQKLWCGFILLFGCVGGVIGTIYAVKDIINAVTTHT